MKYYVLYNPLAGNGGTAPSGRLAERLSGRFAGMSANEQDVVRIDITTVASYAAWLSSLAPDDVIVLCGGDGTVNRFVNDTDGLDLPQDVLYIPAGTGNDFLRDVGKTPADCPFSLRPYIKDLPYVEVKGKRYRFLNNVGFGIDGYCCEVGDAEKIAKPGVPVNYTAVAIKGLLFHYKPTTATVIVDGETFVYKKAWLAPTMKGRYYGGGMIATPSQDRADPAGTLSVMLFHGKGRLSTLMAFPSIFKGEHVKHKKMVSIHTGKEIRVIFDSPRAVQIDGETVTGVTEYCAYSADRAPVAAEAHADAKAQFQPQVNISTFD